MAETFRVLVADDLSPRAIERLQACGRMEVDVKVGLTPAELQASISGYHGLIVRSSTQVDAPLLETARQLRVVGHAGMGVDNIDVPVATRRGVIVTRTSSGNAVTVGEYAIAMLLSLARRIPAAAAAVKAGRWEPQLHRGTELFDKTLGIVGLGNIGRVVAERARGLRMKVLAQDPHVSVETARAVGAELVSLDELLARSDFITLHVPLQLETAHLLDAKAFARMKPGVFVVNVASGGLLDEGALLAALERGQVAGAALDVCGPMAPGPRSLWAHEHVILTPHLGASTEEAQEKVSIEVAEQMVAFVERGEVRNPVNLPALPTESLPKLAPWLDLAARLGALAGQIARRDGRLEEVEVEVLGDGAALGSSALARTALGGLLRTFFGMQVNEVNALAIAEERKVRLTEITRPSSTAYANSIIVRSRGTGAPRLVQGTISDLGGRPEPRVVRIDDFALDAATEGHVLLIRNADRPGVIGAVGTLLGRRGINVSRLHVGLDAAHSSAIMLWNVEAELDAGLLEELRQLPNVDAAQQVSW